MWQEGWSRVHQAFAGLFGRVDALVTALDFVLALTVDVSRKNCWTLGDLAGHTGPGRFQHLLCGAKWSVSAARTGLRDYVVASLGLDDAVLVVDETGDVKKGTKTVGVQRQYTGTAGRIENAQVAVYLAYATDDAHALLDTELYLPRSWTGDRERMTQAGVPSDVEFATKPALAAAMIARALDGGVKADWVAGDEVYGADRGLRQMLADRRVGYVLAIRRDWQLRPCPGVKLTAQELAQSIPTGTWQTYSAGQGAKGPRMYEWAWTQTQAPSDTTPDGPGYHYLLIRRHPRTHEMALYLCFSPNPARLATLVRIAGRRWRVEESFQQSKELVGLDQHQVRRWDSWQRWVTLAMWAYAFLVTVTLAARTHEPAHPGTVRLSVNEVRRLLTAHRPPPDPRHTHHWSHWRRQHQYRAKQAHYRRRSNHEIRL
ncbi:MAG: IS701 family transposase [Bifidobacteriaceae bacterium]|nr:IS701 family transposase [Bifidobacteriaceae bacterium]